MNLANLLDPDLIAIDLKANSKTEAVEQLSELFYKKYPNKDKQAILKAVAEREELGSTSLGRGFAFPHARTNAVEDLHIVVGIDREGVVDRGPDEMPIKVICLFLTPLNISRLYLQALSGLANVARRPGMLDKMLGARSPLEFIEIIANTDIQIKEALTVSDIMIHDVAAVSPDDSLRTVANIMLQYSLDIVPVIDSQGKLLGEVSGKELIKSALPNYEKLIANRPELEPFENLLRQKDKLCVSDVLRHEVATIAETASLFEAAATMISHDVDRLMVLRDEKLVGIITASHIISKIIRG
jgi:PTS system nitrogen regulatory IIA component